MNEYTVLGRRHGFRNQSNEDTQGYSMHDRLTRGVLVVVVMMMMMRRGFKTWWETTIVVLGGYQLF
jgi:hypothetical protein